jgi:excisionase family DNA binding protein
MIIKKPDGYISINEAKERLGVCLRTIQRLVKENKIQSVKLVNKRVYVNEDSLQRYGEKIND